ncbi:MAG: Crp/Fnr family transcriptional regulator [Cyanobacteria bacterium J06623_7]
MTIDILEQEYLSKNLEPQTFHPGAMLTFTAEHYWLLREGVVKTYTWTEEGTPISFGYWSTNDLIGYPTSPCYPFYAKCLTKVEAGFISAAQTRKIITLVQRQIIQNEEILFILRADKMYQRLKQILIWLGQKFGREVGTDRVIQLRLTHQDLAELIGATRVTITKLINQLENEDFLFRPKRNTIALRQSFPEISI